MVTLETSKLFGQLPAHELKPLQAVTQFTNDLDGFVAFSAQPP